MDGQKLGNLNPSFYPNHPNFANATIIIHNYSQGSPEQTNFGTSNKKVILSQCSAALAIFTVNFVISSFVPIFFRIGETIGHQFFPDEYYINTTIILGLIAGGFIAQNIGGRMTIILGGIILAGGLICTTFISSINIFIWTTHIIAFTTGIIQGPSYVYLAEISQPNTRSSLMSIAYLSPIVGAYFNNYVMKFASLKLTICVTAMFPIFGYVVLFFLPDSPYWLANKGRYDKVESSLAWFRGWTVPSDVKSESTMIINSAQKNSSVFKLFGQKSLYVPMAIILYVFIIKAFVGYSYITIDLPLKLEFYFMDGSSKIFEIFDYCRILPAITFVFAVTFISKRNCLLWSLFSTSVGLIVTYIFIYLEKSSSSLVAPVAATIFGFSAGILQVPLLLNGELFPSRLRNVGAGLGLFFMYEVQYLAEKFYFESSWTINSIIITLACVSMFGFISLVWLFPRNENKILVEIEESSNSIESLRKKK